MPSGDPKEPQLFEEIQACIHMHAAEFLRALFRRDQVITDDVEHVAYVSRRENSDLADPQLYIQLFSISYLPPPALISQHNPA